MIEFSDPPERRRRKPRSETRHLAAAEALKGRPNEWAIVDKYENARSAYQLAYLIRNGKISAYRPAGKFEATMRARTSSDESPFVVYARYLG